MYNAKYIIPGLLVFLALCTAPFWLNACAPTYTRPEIKLPKDETQCIEPVEYMRAEHMQILNEWRDKALREGLRSYTASDGRVWEISLQKTCMSCHDDKEGFCDACHTPNSVSPYCWDCHIEPQQTEAPDA